MRKRFCLTNLQFNITRHTADNEKLALIRIRSETHDSDRKLCVLTNESATFARIQSLLHHHHRRRYRSFSHGMENTNVILSNISDIIECT